VEPAATAGTIRKLTLEPYSIWETLAIGALALLVILWFRPGMREALDRSRQVEARWGDLVLPLGVVILFVLFLILTL
jgi:hypothetical protein